jgi:hypothetical protein
VADRTVRVIITGDSTSAEAAFLKLDAAAAASGISLERHSVASVAASGKTKELGTTAEQTAGALQKDLRGGVDDIANALGGHLGPVSGTVTTGIRSMGNEILGASGVMKVAAGAAIVGGVAVLGLGAYALESVGKWAALGESVLKFQRLSGTTAEEASRLIYVMGELGISSDTASAAMFKMTRADPGKLHDLGVEIAYNADGSQNLAGTLDNVRAAYQATQDPVQRSLILFTAFGKAGQALGPYLAMSAEQLRIFNDEAAKHHAIFTQDELDQAHNYTLATRNMSAAMEGLGLELAKTIVPALTSLVQVTTSGVESVDRWATGVEGATKHAGFWNDVLQGMQPKQDMFVKQADAGGKSMSVWSSIVKEVLHPQEQWHAAVQDSGNAAEKAGKQTAAATEASKAQADQLKVDIAVMAANTGGIYMMNDADVQHVVTLGKNAKALDDVKNASKLLTDQEAALVKAVQAFIDPLAVYTDATKKQAAADQAAAQAAGLSKDQQKYSQDDWISHTHVTTAQYLDDLTKQVNDQTTWEANMVSLASRASAGTLQYLAELGPKGAPLVAQLVNASDAEMDRMNTLMDAKSQTATQAVVDRIKQAKPVWEAVMTEGGQGAVSALTAQLNAGTITVADIASAYGVKLAQGINPILASLGKAQIDAMAYGGAGPRPMAFGGLVSGEGGPRDDRVPILASDGEFVVNAKATEQNRAALEWMNAAKFADGGYVGFEDGSKVPRPPSSRPFQFPISTVVDDVMQREYDEAVKWVNENGGGGLPEIKAWINAQSGKPYIWGGGGPGGYDCSGYTGAVYGAMTHQGYGQGQRYFTTLSDFHALGFKDGPGGTYTIGVSPSHMVGRYGGLPFEAGHTPIVAGPGAQNTAHFPRQYHMGGDGPGQGVGAGSGGLWLGDSGTPAGGAKGYAQSVLNSMGIGDQFGALDFIFTNESGWDAGPGSVNPSSGAYGIPQANPSGGQGHPYELGDWKAQVDWGINYIAQRYGDPNGAAAFWRSHNWYDDGGPIPPGSTLVNNGTGQNEYILNQQQFSNLAAMASRGGPSGRQQPTVVKQFNMGGVVVRDTAGAVMDEFHRLELLAGV